jgi:glycosyltransferase involved in cell wall biosynthesis
VKLLRVVGSLNPQSGGVSQALRSLIDPLRCVGVQCEVATSDPVDSQWIEQDAFPIHALGPGRFGYSYSPKWIPWLAEHLSNYDAVLVDGLWQWPSIASLVARQRHARSTKLYVMPHGMLDPWFQKDSSRRWKALRNAIYWSLVEKHVVNLSEALLFTCSKEMLLAQTTFPGYAPARESVVGLGVADPPEPSLQVLQGFRNSLPSLEEKPYLLHLSRIHPKKGADLLVAAYTRLLVGGNIVDAPDLVVAGPGLESSHGQNLRREIDSANAVLRSQYPDRKFPPHIHVVGMLEGDAKWGALHGCSAFVLPSHQENFGIAVVEALACGKPVLISNKVNIAPEILSAGAGLVEEDTVEGTMQLLRAFLDGRISRDTETFRNCHRDLFSIESSARRMADLLNSTR